MMKPLNRQINSSRPCAGPALWLAIVVLAVAAFLPRAAAPADKGKADLIFAKAQLSLIIAALERQTGDRVTLKGAPATAADIVITQQNKTTEEILDLLAATYNWYWWQNPENGGYELMDKETYEKTVLIQMVVQKIFRPRYRTADEIASSLDSLKTPNIGTIATDPTTNKVIVTDLPDRLVMMQKLVDEIDIPMYTRIFQIRFAKVSDIEGQISPLLSEVGTIQTDERTHQIIVRDHFENIKQMELLILALDKGPVMRVYEINNIGPDGDTFKELVDALSKVVTGEDAIWSNPDQGRIYVEDVPEVQDKVQRLIDIFDQPVKQIHIQAEIIEVALKRDYSFEMNWEFGKSMEQAINLGLSQLPGLTVPEGFNFVDLKANLPFFSGGSGGFGFTQLRDRYGFDLSTMLSDNDTKVLLKPQLNVKNQEMAKVHVGAQEPILTTYVSSAYGGTDNTYNPTTYGQSSVSVGLDVEITPSISSSGLVEMSIYMVNSKARRVDLGAQPGTSENIQGLATDDESADTVMIVPSGETRVIGGFIHQENIESKSGVPFLRNIPYIGAIFGSYTKATQDRTLLFFITPTIVEEKPIPRFVAASAAAYADAVSERREALVAGPAGEDARPPLPWQEDGATSSTIPGTTSGIGLVNLAPGESGPSASGDGPQITLSDAPPPNLGAGSYERALEDTPILRAKSNYKISLTGPSGRITPADRSAIVTASPTPLPGPTTAPAPPEGAPTPAVEPTPPTPTPQPTPTPIPGPAEQDKDKTLPVYGPNDPPQPPNQ